MKAVTALQEQHCIDSENNIFLFGAPLICLRDQRKWDPENKGMLSVNSKGQEIYGALTTAWQRVSQDEDGVYYFVHIDDPLFDGKFSDVPLVDLIPEELKEEMLPEDHEGRTARQYVSEVIIGQDQNLTVVDDFTPAT